MPEFAPRPLRRSGVHLSNETLPVHAASARVPRYRREGLRPGVVHMSVGSFHRSHQAVYFDDLAERGARDWGVVGVGLRRAAMRDALTSQDGLYTVLTRAPGGDRARIVGAMTRYLLAPEEDDAVLATLADESTSVVTLTITADAYRPGTSAVDYLVEGLARRRRIGLPPFTVLSCDNLPDNGGVARDAVCAHAERRDPSLARWIEEHAAFPCSMVDRITPKTTMADRDRLARQFGIRDRWPVVTEPFSQWILEDCFSAGRPPLEEVGVQFVTDVEPYALMKTRLLNATHCALGFLGSVAGLGRTDEVVADEVFRSYVDELMAREVTEVLEPVPGVDLDAYRDSVLERLSNQALGDRLERLCRAGGSKLAAHVLPSLYLARAQGTPCELLAIAAAGWLRYLRGIDEAGRRFPVEEPAKELRRVLSEDRQVRRALDSLERRGVRSTMAAALDTEGSLAA